MQSGKKTETETSMPRFLTTDELIQQAEDILEDFDPANIWQDPEKVLSGISETEITLNKLKRANSENTAIISRLEKQLVILQTVTEVNPNYIILQNGFKLLKKESEKDDPSMAFSESVLNSINNSMQQIWGKDATNVPPGMLDDIKTFPDQVALILDIIRDKSSEKHYQEAMSLYEKQKQYLDTNSSDSFTDKINYTQENLKEIRKIVPRIASKKMIDEVEEKYSEVQQEITNFHKARLKAYQKWVLNKCTDAIAFKNEKKIFRNKDAYEMFDKYELARVDHSLLSPEVSSTFNHVMQKIIKELSGKDAFEIEIQMALTKKKTLEEF